MFKNTSNLSKLKTENRLIKDKIISDIETVFEQEDDHYRPL